MKKELETIVNAYEKLKEENVLLKKAIEEHKGKQKEEIELSKKELLMEVKNLESEKDQILNDLELLNSENKDLVKQIFGIQKEMEELKNDNIRLSGECSKYNILVIMI